MKTRNPARRFVATITAFSLVLLFAAGNPAQAGHKFDWLLAKRIVGNWHLALDAGPFAPPFAGKFLSGLAQFHSDRTFTIVDAGDYGSDSFFNSFASPQHGSWRYERTANGRLVIRGTTLYLEAAGETGDMLAWNKVHFEFRVVGRNRVEGTMNAFVLPCPQEPPFPTPLTCPDPIANAAAFVPASPPDVPLMLTRIVVGQ